jgi:hypothetical protein
MNMRKIVFLILLSGIWTGVIAQNSIDFKSVDNSMLQIPESSIASTQGIAGYINSNFSSANDKSRAIFIWIVRNIQYDVANMFVLKTNLKTNERIEKTLKTRKGVCSDYADLFNDIAGKTGIKSYVIPGYTKQKGVVDNIPHAWCAAMIDSTWYLFDPTWGSGYLQNAKFVKQVNNFYFKTKPEQIIKSHISFDPLWQFSNYPITNHEFYEGKNQVNTKKLFFNFKDTLAIYEKQSEMERLVSSSNRIEANGVKNSLIFNMLQYNKREIEVYNNNRVVDQYNSAGISFNIGVNLLNDFINYRNKQFTPKKTDSGIQQMIDTVESSFRISLTQLNNIKNPDVNSSAMITQLNRSIRDATTNLNEQKSFLEKYLKTGKMFRKSLFYKYSWMGIPVH